MFTYKKVSSNKRIKKIPSFVLGNQNGASGVVIIMIMGVVMATTVSSLYIYFERRAEYVRRIREIYTMSFVTEEMAKYIRSGYDQYEVNRAIVGDGNCPGGFFLMSLDDVDLCFSTNKVKSCITFGYDPNTGNPKEYCIQDGNFQSVQNDYLPGSQSEGGVYVFRGYEKKPEIPNQAILDKWYVKLDSFFESEVMRVPVDWTQIVNKAYADFADTDAQNAATMPYQAGGVGRMPPQTLGTPPPQNCGTGTSKCGRVEFCPSWKPTNCNSGPPSGRVPPIELTFKLIPTAAP